MSHIGINMENVKIKNRRAILKLLNDEGSMSRKDIAKTVSLTPASVTQLCSEMIQEGIIVEKGEIQEKKRAGRKKVLIDIDYDHKIIVAISIESDFTYIAITNMKGHKIIGNKIDTINDIQPEEFLKQLSDKCKTLLWENNKTCSDILGIGICIPGIVDRKSGMSIHAYGIWEKNVNVAKIMSELMNCQVIVENNVKAFAEGELIYGLGRTGNDLLFVKWGPGVGSAIVIRNQVYEGMDHKAAEIGHYIIEPNGELCKCGRRGCLETRVSTNAIVNKVKSVYSIDNTPILHEKTKGNIEEVKNVLFSMLIYKENNLMEQIDEVVKDILIKSIDRLARAIVNAITMLAPNHTILFGKMFENDEIRNIFIDCCMSYDSSYTEGYIMKSKLNDKKYYIGSTAIVARELFFERGGLIVLKN